MASDGWHEPSIGNYAPLDGGSHLGPVTVGVLHVTQSKNFYPTQDSYYGHSSYPHFTCQVKNSKFVSYQHVSLRRAARALRNQSGGVQTNREGVIQIEIVGYAESPFTDDPVMIAGLQDLMRWIESETDIPRRSTVKFHPYPPDQGAKLGSEPWRMSPSGWQSYAGWCGHQHVPENFHGDPGAINIEALLKISTTTPPVVVKPIEEPEVSQEKKMYIVTDPREPRPQFVTDMIHKRWIRSLAEHTDITDSATLIRTTLSASTLDAILTVGEAPVYSDTGQI